MRLWTPLLVTMAVCPIHAQDASKPDHAVVPGFERFFAKSKENGVRGGRLLLSELGCIACHKAEADTEKRLLKKEAPILDGVGSRVRLAYLRAFLSDPQAAKPGTTMPNLLAALPEEERKDSLEALVHFFASTGNVKDSRPVPKSMASGKKLFHRVGCAACHGPREGKLKEEATVLPLGELAKKYTISGLSAFLQDPHKTRPSGRMPGLHLTSAEAQDIAQYLLSDLVITGGGANVNYAYYELEKEPAKLPDLAKLKPVATGVAVGFDLGVVRRTNNVAMKFDGYLMIDQEGFYNFHVTSDDGAKLWIKDGLVVDNDGIHPPGTKSGGLRLPKGKVPFTVAVFNAGGGYELDIDFEGPGLARQPLANFVVPTTEKAPPISQEPAGVVVVVDKALAKKGKEVFARLGCASCHNLKDGKSNIPTELKAPALAKLDAAAGCLAQTPPKGAPHYSLNAVQRSALTAALKAPLPEPTATETIAATFTTFNCYACHQRDGIGGVEPGLNDFFTTTQKEMGDEGRMPPHLDGAGGKLTSAYLKKVLASGATDRPYMLTRMPKFGEGNVGRLQSALEDVDPVPSAPVPTFNVADKKVKSEGRLMVGNKAFGCIKCHNFREHKSGGLQGINMTVMAERVRREWFSRYLLDPNKYRPGTRMPAVWPFGQSQLPKVLEGDTARQIEAIWRYLADGPKAALPYGVGREPLPLIAQDTPVLYRNFIEGAGSRAIGVGYPEKVNLAFDANDLRYALLWHKEFMDASRHWSGRGEGYQPPLGEGILALPPGPAVAFLKSKDDPWPAKALKDKGYKFRGYRLDDKQRPVFTYELGEVHVDDFMLPIQDKDGEHLQRTLTVARGPVPENLWFRAAAGASIKDLGDGWYAVGSDLKVRVESTAPRLLRTTAGKMELLVPIRDQRTKIIQELVW
jgi:mono/diheme cytochrome c family protein